MTDYSHLNSMIYIFVFLVPYLDHYLANDILFPEGNYESSAREGPLDSLSILYVIDEPKLRLHKYPILSDFLKVPKTFIPRREVRKHSRWGPIDFLMVYCH